MTQAWRIVVVGVAVALALPHMALAQERMQASSVMSGCVPLRIDLHGGALRIISWDQPKVVASLRRDGDNRLTLKADGDGIVVRAFGEGGYGPGEGDLEVRMLKGCDVTVSTIEADIDASGTYGDVELGSINGRVRLQGEAKVVHLESVSGNVEMDVSAPRAQAKSISGDVTVRGAIRDLDASSVSGEVEVGFLGAAKRVRLSSVSGNVGYKGSIEGGGSLEAETHSGDVTLRLPPREPVDITIHTRNGEVESLIDGLTTTGSRNGVTHMAIGNAGPMVQVRTFSGDVHLAPK